MPSLLVTTACPTRESQGTAVVALNTKFVRHSPSASPVPGTRGVEVSAHWQEGKPHLKGPAADDGTSESWAGLCALSILGMKQGLHPQGSHCHSGWPGTGPWGLILGPGLWGSPLTGSGLGKALLLLVTHLLMSGCTVLLHQQAASCVCAGWWAGHSCSPGHPWACCSVHRQPLQHDQAWLVSLNSPLLSVDNPSPVWDYVSPVWDPTNPAHGNAPSCNTWQLSAANLTS